LLVVFVFILYWSRGRKIMIIMMMRKK
jgi:hypothetical protein